jgi:hypothetical protein
MLMRFFTTGSPNFEQMPAADMALRYEVRSFPAVRIEKRSFVWENNVTFGMPWNPSAL